MARPDMRSHTSYTVRYTDTTTGALTLDAGPSYTRPAAMRRLRWVKANIPNVSKPHLYVGYDLIRKVEV